MNKNTLMLGAGAYALAVNAGAAYTFYYDKEVALENERIAAKHNKGNNNNKQHKYSQQLLPGQQMRVPEKVLCATALAGGWLGGSLNNEKCMF